MALIVIDASAIGRSLLPDEGGPVADRFDACFANERITGPGLITSEVTRTIVGARRGRRIDRREMHEALRAADRVFDVLTIDVACHPSRAADLAEAEGLSLQDAFYLELALRLGCTILTADTSLARAADARGILEP